MKTLKHSRPYNQARQGAYPATGDQLDAVFKFAEAMQEAGFPMPEATAAWIEKCRKVKERHPKPAVQL